jgi:hypothetical protein
MLSQGPPRTKPVVPPYGMIMPRPTHSQTQENYEGATEEYIMKIGKWTGREKIVRTAGDGL